MKHFFCKLTALLLLAALPFATYFVYVQAQPTTFDGSLMGSVRAKLQVLQSTDGSRVLVAGGSSVPYSVACAPVAEAAGMPCINLGATAYLGLEYYLSMMRGELHAGDIVVLAPEFSMYLNDVSYSTLWMAVENDFNALAKVPLSYWPGMARTFYSYANEKLAKNKLFEKNTKPMFQNYLEYGFSYWGDILTGHPDNILEQGYNTQDTLTMTASSADARILRQMRAFGRYAKRKGARVYITYAPFNRLALHSTLEEIDALQARIEAETGLPFLGKLRDGVMDEALFFNSNNHLNEAGQTSRTQALVDDLRPVFAGKIA